MSSENPLSYGWLETLSGQAKNIPPLERGIKSKDLQEELKKEGGQKSSDNEL